MAIFACFLLELSSHRGQYQRTEIDFISELATKLRLAINVTERVGNDALQAKRVAKVLTKLVALTNVMFGSSGHPAEAQDSLIRDNDQRHQVETVQLADSFQQQNLVPLDTLEVGGSSAADVGFELGGNEIFNAFEDLQTDWDDLDLSSLAQIDDLEALDLMGAFTM